MLNVLKLPENSTERWKLIHDIQISLLHSQGYELSTANAYWLRQGEGIKPQYRDIIENYYLAHGEEVDFSHPSKAAERINSWVSANTNGRIDDLLTPYDIGPETYLILTNAIYFKSQWLYQFNESATEEGKFYHSDGTTAMAEFMHMCDKSKPLYYAEDSHAKMVQLPYKNNEVSMFILLPKENNISSLERILSEDYFNNLKSKMKGRWVDLYMPRFSMDTKYYLKDKLMAMGIKRAFTPLADFSGITNTSIAINQVIHRAHIDVDESGTEAAAATAVVMRKTGASLGEKEEKPVLFRADHPFIFIIQHSQSGMILFMGKAEKV